MSKFSFLVAIIVLFGIGACDDDPVKKSTLWCDNQCVNGVCTPEGDGALCVCDTGYTGTLCNECRPGYERDVNDACVPVANDPCLQQPCLNEGECEAVDEVEFICHCAEGYTGDTCQQCDEGFVRSLEGTCVPEQIDDPCDSNPCFTGECIADADGENFTCNCTEEGYTGEFCQSCDEGYARLDDMSCVANPCLNEHCSGHGVCQLNTATAEASCECFEGYQPDGLSCTDVDECSSNPCDANATCANTDGDFICECNEGYEGDGFVCSDINECSANPCDANATCGNTDGAFTCECNEGYEGDGFVCSDINECLTNPCLGHADCSNTAGSYECSCQIGYIGLGCDTCDDGFVNVAGACVANTCDPNPCLNDGICVVNGGGVAECSCPAGYTGTYCQSCEAGYVQLVSGTCVLDTCAGQTCSGHGECLVDLNTGNASCACDDGFNVSGLSCTDINECVAGTDNCDVNATCANTAGSFTCICNSGFSGDGVTCSDINECSTGTDNCSDDATCSNTLGSFTCSCNVGFSGDGVSCSDINECALGTDNCDVNATCANTAGSFTCSCNVGFSGDGVSCSDINECALGTDNCDANATCVNTAGSFTCTCNAGYTGNGVTCSDNDECSLGTDNCSDNATCANTLGGFTCSCNSGFSGNGVTCSDVNECALGTDNCSDDATCGNTLGSFTCTCNSGYTGDGVVCSDINECVSNPCPANATCANTAGSYTCTCLTGYTGSNCDVCDTANGYTWDGSDCTLDPCFSEDCSGHGTCSVQGGLPVCSCETGYTGTDCADCAENYRLLGGFCQPMFGRLSGGSIYNFVEVGGDLYGFGQNEVVVKYDEVEDNWLEVWRPDIDWTGNNTAGSVRNDFMAAASDGTTVYLLQHYFAKQEWNALSGSNRNIVRTFTPGAANPWGQLVDLPPTGTQAVPIHCNDLGVNTSGDLLWAVCNDGTVYKYDFGTNSWDGELVHDSTAQALNKIWVESSDSIFVVGDDGLLKRWNGAVWEDWSDPIFDTDLYGVWGYSSTDLYVGGQGKLWHWNGAGWTLKFSQTSSPTTHYVRKIHGTPDHSRIVALSIGDYNDWSEYTSHVWQSVGGGAWTSPGSSMYYWSVYCSGLVDDSCYIGGSNGTIDTATRVIRLGAGGEERMLYITLGPNGVFGNSPEDLLFVGLNAGTHFDGSRYADLPLDSVGEAGNLTFMATWSSGLGYWIVGPKNYVIYWDGLGYGVSNLSKYLIDTADFILANDRIYAVHGLSSSNVWAAGSRGATFRWDGSSWTRFNLPHVDATVSGLYVVSLSEVYAIARANTYTYVYKWDGMMWAVVYSGGTGYYPQNIIYDGENYCASLQHGSASRVICSVDGNNWSVYITGSAGMSIKKIWGRKTNLFACGSNGLLLNYRAGQETWIHRETSNTDDNNGNGGFVGVWKDPASDYTVIIGAFSKVLVHR